MGSGKEDKAVAVSQRKDHVLCTTTSKVSEASRSASQSRCTRSDMANVSQLQVPDELDKCR